MMDLMFVILEIIILLLFLSIFYKLKKNKSHIFYVVLMIVIIYLTNKMMNANLNAIVNLSIYILLALLLYDGQILNKSFFVIIFFTLSILSDFITNYIMQNIFRADLSELISNTRYFLYSSVFSKFLMFLFIFLISLIKKKNEVNVYNANRYALTLTILPISSMFVLFGILDLIDNIAYLNILMYVGACGLVLSNIYIYYLFNKVLWSDMKNNELEHLKEINNLNNQYFKMQEDNYNMKKALIHDIKKHINYIAFVVGNEDYDVLKKYMEELQVRTFFIDKNYTGIKVLDIIVNSKMEKIKANQIKLKFDIDKSICFSNIQLIDQNVLFSNLFENCLENTCKVETRFISIKIRHLDNDHIIIKFINTFNNEVKGDSYKDLQSTKKESNEHGFGTKIIAKIVEKYEGKVFSDIDLINNLFIVTIIFDTSCV